MRSLVAAIAACVLFWSIPAEAHHRHHLRHQQFTNLPQLVVCDERGCREQGRVIEHIPQVHRGTIMAAHGRNVVREGNDPRPALWCAWWLRRHLGIPKSAFRPYEYNLARGFLHIGTPANNGCIGCIAVFRRGGGGHVGVVERWDSAGNPVILSGNYNNAVTESPHPARRLLGLRWWS